jgi:hypothetical protein
MDAHIQFTNASQTPIFVVMDTSRGRALILPNAQATFHPNIGDNPTYHVFNVDAQNNPTGEVFSDTFSTLWMTWTGPQFGGDLKWTGSRIERA